jgi:hypothetical protein
MRQPEWSRDVTGVHDHVGERRAWSGDRWCEVTVGVRTNLRDGRGCAVARLFDCDRSVGSVEAATVADQLDQEVRRARRDGTCEMSADGLDIPVAAQARGR